VPELCIVYWELELEAGSITFGNLLVTSQLFSVDNACDSDRTFLQELSSGPLSCDRSSFPADRESGELIVFL